MVEKRGRPRLVGTESKGDYVVIRLNLAEKQGFKMAAEAAGIPLSTWIRERLRRIAARELQDIGRPIPFIKAL